MSKVSPENCSDAALDISELTIRMNPILGYTEYVGTRMQLEAEGVVPLGTRWPEGFESLRWESETNSFWLRRGRPEGAKGPRRSFLDVDNWRLWINARHQSIEELAIHRKEKELARVVRHASPEGAQEQRSLMGRLYVALEDRGFQRFKAHVPALRESPRQRRGRRSSEVSDGS